MTNRKEGLSICSTLASSVLLLLMAGVTGTFGCGGHVDAGSTTTEGGPPTSVLVTPIAFQRSAGGAVQIFTINPDGTSLKQLTADTNHSTEPVWSRDHKRIAFMRQSEIFVMNADGTGLAQVTSHSIITQGSYHPTWSPDSLRIAYHEAVGHVVGGPTLDGLSIVDATGFNHTVVTSGGDAIDDSYPDWSPDGTAIAFQGFRTANGNGRGIVVHTLATHAETFLTPFGVTANYPAWSPGGAQVAYSSTNIFRVNPNGTGATQINTGTGTYTWPRWSPDGTKILAQGTLNGVAGIYLMNLDGTNSTLVPNTENGASPSW